MMPIRTVRAAVLLALLVLVWAPFASAQVDERARALLEGLQPAEAETVDTLDQVMVMTLYIAGGEQVVRTRTVIDYVGERAAIDSELAPGMTTRIVIVDGQARMSMGGMTMPVPPAMAAGFDGMFERDPVDVLGDGASATYDGVQSYGGLVEGEQITVRGGAAVAGIPDAEESRMLFDGQGRLIAVVVDTDEGVMVTVFDEPFAASAAIGRSARMYVLESDGPRLFGTMEFVDVRVNEPIPDGTFD